MRDLISIVIPVYGDKSLVKKLYDKIISAMSKIDADFEIIEVCDACPYGSAEEIYKLSQQDTKVKFINLSRNFGQHIAIKAGIDYANGDYTVVMDCDLQDNPEDIVRFYQKIKETNADVVFGERITRQEGVKKKLYSNIARILMNNLSEIKRKEIKDCGNYSIFNKKVLNELKQKQEPYFVFSTIINWAGFCVDYIDIKQEERAAGKSGYNFIKGLNHFKRIVVNNSNKPLIFAGFCSILMFLFCMLFISKLLIGYFFFNQRASGYTSIMISIFFISGLIFAYLGLLGIYIGQIFKISQNRPIYVIKQKVNL